MNQDLLPDRCEYGDRSFSAGDLAGDPMRMFEEWMEDAVAREVPEANAACLCTVDEQGAPDGRMVLIKGVEAEALLFYTNYSSRKARHLGANPRAAMVLWWEPLRRQIRVRGRVEMIEEELSDRYFASRPRDSQLGAWASRQSESLDRRADLEAELARLEEEFPARVPRPDFWGGYRLKIDSMEFWQGRSSRLHDRFEYRRGDEGWSVVRLSP